MVLVPLSSNHLSVEQQLEDVIAFLDDTYPDDHARFLEAFPEWPSRVWQGGHSGHLDTLAMGVDEEWSSWAIDWIEDHTSVSWQDGEPYEIPITESEE